MTETERIYRGACGQCSAMISTSSYIIAEDWADDHVTETAHAVSIDQVEDNSDNT